jgi:hypothetical protein
VNHRLSIQLRCLGGGGLSKSWKELDNVYGRFCKKLMGIPNCATNVHADMETGKESIRRKCMSQIVKYCYRIVYGYRRSGKTMLFMAEA